MLLDLLLFAACAAVGVAVQRSSRGDVVRERLWLANYLLLIPVAATFAFLTIELDRALLGVIAVGVCAWWLTVLLAGGYARLATRERSRRGALWLVGAFPNTGFIGFPLAHLAFGQDGLRLAIVYDQVSLVVPAIIVSTIIATRHATATGESADEPRRSLLREVLASPPLWVVLVLLALRLTVLPEPLELAWLGSIVAAVVGPVGFLLLGLSIPLHGFTHERREVAETLGAVLVRIAAAPALVWLLARTLQVDVPDALYLIAAMPTAFHALVVSRVHGLEVALVRLGVLVSSIAVVAATVLGLALT